MLHLLTELLFSNDVREMIPYAWVCFFFEYVSTILFFSFSLSLPSDMRRSDSPK